jgi:hypothetical protein
MKLIHSLGILGIAAALGAIGQSSSTWRPQPEATLPPSAQVTTVPWLTDTWRDDIEEDAAGDTDDDPHAGLYADDEAADEVHGTPDPQTCPAQGDTDDDPHAGLYADDEPEVAVASPPSTAALAGASVERSKAPNGKSVAEVFAGRAALAEQRVRVRGTVVKVTENVLGKTYLHLRDGSGREQDGDADLTVTTTESFELGETVEIEGQLAIDQDIGVGIVYAALLGDATRVRL